MRTALFLVLFASLLPATPAGAQGADAPRAQGKREFPFAVAPDGHRGFGAAPNLRALERLFRSAHEADVGFLADVMGLETDARILVQLAKAYHQRRDYFALLGAEGDGLEQLYERFELLRRNPFAEPMGPRRARAFARMLTDVRFRLRGEVLEGLEQEARQVRGGIALFHAHVHGVADLTQQGEVGRIAQRLDLAAARLRAQRLDLEALYDSPARAPERRRGSLETERLIEYLEAGDGAGDELARALDATTQRELERLRDGLFTRRLAQRLHKDLGERERALRRTEEIRAEVRLLLPSTEEGKAPPPDIAAMSRSDRHRAAASAGLEGLWYDPFDQELNYLVGEAYDFFAGRLLSRAYFDRFLVLRGIRHYDHRTYQGRYLDGREEYALWVVADWRPPLRDE